MLKDHEITEGIVRMNVSEATNTNLIIKKIKYRGYIRLLCYHISSISDKLRESDVN